MTFTVTYRSKTGAKAEVEIEAASRSECMAECKRRGIVPIAVREGKRKGSGKNAAKLIDDFRLRIEDCGSPSQVRRPSFSGAALTGKAAILAAAFLAIGGGLWFWLAGARDARPYQTKPPATDKPKTEKPQPPTPRPRAVAKNDAPAPVATNAPAVRSPKEVVSSVVTTNADGAVVEKIVLADGTKKAIVTPPKPIFDNAADQVIALAISTKPGDAMPPLPDLRGIDEDFAKSFLTPIKINDDDPENVKELKRNVIETKKQLLEAMKDGKTVMQALQEHQAEMERMESSRLMAIREMQRISAEDGIEMAQAFAKKVNDDFKGKGIPAIPVIGTHEEKPRRGNK